MKNQLAIIVSLFMLIALCPLTHCTATDDYFECTYLESEDCYEVTGVTNKAKNTVAWNVKIPDEVMDKKVISIGYRAFFDLDGVQSVQLGANIQAIGNEAFSCCENLKAVSYNKNLRTIGDYAFSNCCSLGGPSLKYQWGKNFVVQSERLSVGKGAFAGTAYTAIDFGNAEVSVDEEAFSNCLYLTRISFGYGRKGFNRCAFAFSGLKEVLFPLDWTEEEANANISAIQCLEYDNATKYYFREQEPEKDENGKYIGNYWHYAGGQITLWE